MHLANFVRSLALSVGLGACATGQGGTHFARGGSPEAVLRDALGAGIRHDWTALVESVSYSDLAGLAAVRARLASDWETEHGTQRVGVTSGESRSAEDFAQPIANPILRQVGATSIAELRAMSPTVYWERYLSNSMPPGASNRAPELRVRIGEPRVEGDSVATVRYILGDEPLPSIAQLRHESGGWRLTGDTFWQLQFALEQRQLKHAPGRRPN